MSKKIQIVTHSGNFHTDDVFAVATLKILLDGKDIEIIRTRDEEKIENGDYVVDVGGEHNPDKQRFDHHQEGYAGARENGITYAAFGLVWKEYGEEICGSREVADIIDERVVQPIDALDNGIQISEPTREDVYPYSIHDIISAYRPTWKEDEVMAQERFEMLVSVGRKVLEREIQRTNDWTAGARHTETIYENAKDKRIIILDKRYPWKKVLAEKPEPIYVVYPGRVNEYWRVKTVSESPYDFESRKPLPKAWAGKRDEELRAVTGVDTAVFCHNKRFLVVTEDKEGALTLAQKALDN